MTEEIKIKVLCVEDEQEIRDTMAEILRDEGFDVVEAHDGKAGFEAFLHYKPDIIVSDIMMPEVDGYAFLKMVRESKDKRNAVPFIFLSALGQKDNIIKGIHLLANDYLVKPIDFDLLIAKIREKAGNAIKVEKIHTAGIKNIKSQISSILPTEVSSHLNTISQMLKVLKEEPYGPFPHRRYAEDINKIYLDSIKLKAAIANALDHNVIENRLNENEEIFSLCEFLEHAVSNLPEKFKARIQFDRPYESEFLPKAKMDKGALIEVIKKVIAGVIKADQESTMRISMMMDSLNQMALIFYLKSNLNAEGVKKGIDYAKIEQVSEAQGCDFKIAQGPVEGEVNIVFSIPSYRLIDSEEPRPVTEDQE